MEALSNGLQKSSMVHSKFVLFLFIENVFHTNDPGIACIIFLELFSIRAKHHSPNAMRMLRHRMCPFDFRRRSSRSEPVSRNRSVGLSGRTRNQELTKWSRTGIFHPARAHFPFLQYILCIRFFSRVHRIASVFFSGRQSRLFRSWWAGLYLGFKWVSSPRGERHARFHAAPRGACPGPGAGRTLWTSGCTRFKIITSNVLTYWS